MSEKKIMILVLLTWILILLDTIGVHSWAREFVKENEFKNDRVFSERSLRRDERHQMCWDSIDMLAGSVQHIKDNFWKHQDKSVLGEDGDHGHIGMYGPVRSE